MSQRTKVDWLAGRTRSEVGGLCPVMAPMFGEVGKWLNIATLPRGWMGYESSGELRIADTVIGKVAWGGETQRGWVHVSVSGQGCDWVSDWDRAQTCLEGLAAWEPRRVDIALDTFKRETCHEAVLEAYGAGGFVTSGRRPKLEQYLGADGRTIYIGARSGAKYLRCYEKGREVLAGTGRGAIDGVRMEDWYRIELEAKSKEGPLPEDIIDRRDQYLAGAYPYLQHLLPDVEPEIMVDTRVRLPQLELAAVLENVRVQYGRSLFTALVAYEGDISAVWQRIVGSQHNSDLLRAGVLMVEHGDD